MRQVASRILSVSMLRVTSCWGIALSELLADIDQITDGPETLYACQKRFLFGRKIHLNTIKRIISLTVVLEQLNDIILVFLVLPPTIVEQTRHGYLAYFIFGAWLFLFGILFLFLLYSCLLPVLCSINDLHVVPCLWKDYPNWAAVAFLELSYNLQQESSCDLYFIIRGKRIALNAVLRNELKKKKILKIMAINDKYYGRFIFASLFLLAYAFIPFLLINPFLVGAMLKAHGGRGRSDAVAATVLLAITHWISGIPLMYMLFDSDDYRLTERLGNKIRSLERDEEAPMVRV
jgi:hypothetical protein